MKSAEAEQPVYEKIRERFGTYQNDLDFAHGLGKREYDPELGVYAPVKR